MRRLVPIAASLALFAAPAAAQVDPDDWAPAFDACLAAEADARACVQAAYRPCTERMSPMGGSRAEGECLRIEAAFWMRRITELHDTVLAKAIEEDAGRAHSGRRNSAVVTSALAAERSHWEAWRVAYCDVAGARGGIDGPSFDLAAGRCELRLLADRYVFLRAWAHEGP